MPAVCEEKGLPYVYTPSRWLIRPSLQLLLSSFLQAGPGHCYGGQAGMPDDDGQCEHLSSLYGVCSWNLKLPLLGARTRGLQGALWWGWGRDQGSPTAHSQLIMWLFLWQTYFSSQASCICDLCLNPFLFCATNAENVVQCNCFCNHEKSAEPHFFSAATLW